MTPLKPRGASLETLRLAARLLRELALVLAAPAPLLAIDLEGTGELREYDRICEIGAVKIYPDGTFTVLSTLVNPGLPIASGATEKHGIRDADVVDAPRFGAVAAALLTGIKGSCFVGYNLRAYDLPLLEREFGIVGLDVDLQAFPVLDGFAIYSELFPRTLDAAVRQFCGRDRATSHEAGADVHATIDVLLGQLEQCPELPRTAPLLAAFCERRKKEWVDRGGKFRWRNGEAIIAFTENNMGVPLRQADPGFLRWILGKSFPADVKAIARDALQGLYPTPPAEIMGREENANAATGDAGAEAPATPTEQAPLFPAGLR